MTSTIELRFLGEDYWSRALFKGSNGHYYKTTELNPDNGFESLPLEDQLDFLQSLHTSTPATDPEGEPGWPVDLGRFSFSGIGLVSAVRSTDSNWHIEEGKSHESE